MANFDEDIKRITDEILSDGTVDQIIREKVTDGIEKAIASSFNYGKLEKAVKERVEQVLVPFIEKLLYGLHHRHGYECRNCYEPLLRSLGVFV